MRLTASAVVHATWHQLQLDLKSDSGRGTGVEGGGARDLLRQRSGIRLLGGFANSLLLT